MTTGSRSHHQPPGPARALTQLFAVLLALLIAGCGIQELRPGSADSGASPDAATLPEDASLPPPQPPVAVVLSGDTDHYRSVADALGEGHWRRFVLTDDDAGRVLEALREEGAVAAIAIGHQALALLAPTALDVAYCQVFDAASVVAAGRHGVAPLPAYGAQLDVWRARNPSLQRIGLITGPTHADVGATVQAAAADRGLVVDHALARSDRELLYVFRRMVPDIQGFLLYPDTSVLSPRTIRQLLAYASKHGVDVLTYNRSVFELGATLLVSADPAEVASQVLAALHAEGSGGELPLSRVVVETAEQLQGGAE